MVEGEQANEKSMEDQWELELASEHMSNVLCSVRASENKGNGLVDEHARSWMSLLEAMC